eukprot:CAMPEP_0206215252 /NCGR_PEP_ID=MMETSP0047_2-20121206/2092_1 /ASSEMBLY_ACC=CAM_ASM_000192 /TAXON_ID=195065 /ORGANISM="Chroomonas mesostigmatica_cf, Strain CCMP1168" /LENGTH=143 /DNA_ID=CAMNT_0053637527 /DNA_START=336 /DNA_END=767 /DNA_ORIENTATION=-
MFAMLDHEVKDTPLPLRRADSATQDGHIAIRVIHAPALPALHSDVVSVQKARRDLQLAHNAWPDNVVKSAFPHQIVDVDRLELPNPMHSVLRLYHDARRPVELDKNHSAGGSQRQPGACCCEAQDSCPHRLILLEQVDALLPL